MRYSVILPVLNEEAVLSKCLENIRAVLPDAEVIVADGGSSDNSRQVASKAGVRVVVSVPGRGTQMNTGAAVASGDILVFLHADSHLPLGAGKMMGDFFKVPSAHIGTFRLAFDDKHWLLRCYAWMTRFDSVFTRFGDQCIFIRRLFFDQIGGFPNWPLFEDVHFLRMARKRTKIFSLPAAVQTSARRFLENGIFIQQVRNAGYLFQYLGGVSPQSLAARYAKGKAARRRLLKPCSKETTACLTR